MPRNLFAQDLYKGKQDKHHLLPSSRNGNNKNENIIKINVDIHQALHRLFGNMTIDEQLKRIEEINHNALSGDFSQRLLNLLTEDKEYYYKDGIYLNKIR